MAHGALTNKTAEAPYSFVAKSHKFTFSDPNAIQRPMPPPWVTQTLITIFIFLLILAVYVLWRKARMAPPVVPAAAVEMTGGGEKA